MDFLDQVYFDNTVRAYLIVAGIILFVLLLKRLLSHTVASLLFVIIKNNWKNIDRAAFIKLIIKPLGWFIFAMITVFALDKLNYPTALDAKIYGHSLQQIIQKAGVVFIIVTFTWFIVSLINFIALILEQKALLTKDKSDDQIIIFFRDFLKVIAVIFGVLLVLKSAFNQNIGSLLTGLSIVGAALALAGKESLENLIASFIIFFDKPFYTGDTLRVNNVSGTVERIGLRSTRIRTTEKTLVTVPNKQMVDSVVDNMSMRSLRRAEIKLELSEKTTVEKAKTFMSKAKELLVHRQAMVVKFSVFLTEFSKNGLTITIEYFTAPSPMSEYNKLKQEINFDLMALVAAEDLSFASGGSSINIINTDLDAGAPKQQEII